MRDVQSRGIVFRHLALNTKHELDQRGAWILDYL